MRPSAGVLLLAVTTAGLACFGGDDPRPGIPDSLQVAVLVEVYTATAEAHLAGVDPDSARAAALNRFGLDTADLNRSLDYFAANPDSGAAVYQKALDSLVFIQRDLRSAPELDSLAAQIRG